MFKKLLLLFITLFYTNLLAAQQFFLGESGHHQINYYVVEIKGDTALVENFEFDLVDVLDYQATVKLVKTNSGDTLFSNGRTKIVSQNGKMWIYWGKCKRKLKDYTQKQEVITYIRKNHSLLLPKNTIIAQLNQTLGARNYDLHSLDIAERTLSIETPRDSALKVFQIVADSIRACLKILFCQMANTI
jgi:hypothetical protein